MNKQQPKLRMFVKHLWKEYWDILKTKQLVMTLYMNQRRVYLIKEQEYS